MSNIEAAEILEVSVEAVESLLARGRPDEALGYLNDELELLEQAHREQVRAEAEVATDSASVEDELEAVFPADAETTSADDAIDLWRLSNLLLDAGAAQKAVPLLERYIDEEGESVESLRRLALARYRSGDRDGGTAASRRVLRLQPDCVVSLHNLALAALEERRLRIASGWISRGLAVNRQDDGLRRLRVRLWLAAFGFGVRDLAQRWRVRKTPNSQRPFL